MSTEFQKKIDLAVGKKIETRRRLMGLSRAQLASHLGVTSQQMQKYESGLNSLKSSRLLQVAKVLEVDANWFFDQEFSNNDQKDDLVNTLMSDDNIARLVTCYLWIIYLGGLVSFVLFYFLLPLVWDITMVSCYYNEYK